MKRTVIALLAVSICFGGDDLPAQFEKIKETLQKKYQVYSLEDLYKLKNPAQPSHRTASRDMEDIVGDWMVEEEHMGLFVTVGTDQSIPDPFTTMGLAEAEGSVTATASDYETDLTYLIMGLFDEDDDGDSDYDTYSYYPTISSPEECEQYAYDNGYEWNGIFCDADHHGIEPGCYQPGGNDVLEWQDNDESLCDGRSRSRDDHYGGTIDFDNIADMDYARYGAAYATDGDMVYAFCGADYDSSTIYHTHGERYNPDTDSWEMFGEDLLPRRYTNAEYLNGNIYVFNGYNGSGATDTVEIINTTTGEVSYSATNPYPVWYGGSAVWNDKIYIFGGGNGSEYSNRLYEFDPLDESWTRLADMPDSTNTNGIVVNGVLYTFGGYNGSGLDDINAYHISDDVWETVGEMPTDISANSVATDGDLIFVIGDYEDIEFCGVYDPLEGEFFELESNMAGRRHSASVFLDGEIYAYGGSQPEGFNGNDTYVILSSAERGNLEIDGDEWSPEGIITNLDLMEFFMLMFGIDPDSIGVENPVVVGTNATATESGDIVLDEVRAMVFSDGEMSELEADPEEAIAATIIDISTGAVTFNSLSLYDATGTAALTLSGTIGPGILDFVAGQETEFPFLEDLEDLFEEDDEDIFLYFYEDSTGTEIQAKYFEGDEYYDEGIYVDTSYFTWYATSDSLFLYTEYDDYDGEGVDTTELEYYVNGDTLFMGASFDVCEGEPLEECLEFANEEIAGLEDLEDVESLRLSGEMVLMPGSYSSVDPGDGTLPEEFNLYANYPNPFNPVTTIRFDVGSNSGNNTILRIYDITGRNITTLINRQLQTGTYEVRWDARGFPSGLYFSELISGTKRQTQKMILLK